MHITLEPMREDHGTMPWTGQFDEDGYALFQCPICGRTVGLNPCAKRSYRSIAQGDFYAKHNCATNLAIVEAALKAEIWTQTPGNHEVLEAWRKAGGGPPFTIGNIKMSAPGEQ